MGGTVLAPVRRLGDRFKGRSTGDVEGMTTPAKVRLMLQQLGPTYVKLGQMVSSRADALPPEWSTELDKLQSTVPPFSWESARRIITEELGAEPEELFGSVEPEPFAAASLAQVHRATLKDGRAVVIKVQRPDVQSKVRADLGVIAELASVAESRSGLARQLDAGGLVKEFSNGVLEELDYTVEAYHARRLADVLESMEGVGVPSTYPELSTDRVLTMDFVPGVKATRAEQLDPSVDRETVARTFIRATIKQILVDGFFHADPHPGNIMLDTKTGKLTFLDLGLVGELRQEQRFDLLALLWALTHGGPAGVGRRRAPALRGHRARGRGRLPDRRGAAVLPVLDLRQLVVQPDDVGAVRDASRAQPADATRADAGGQGDDAVGGADASHRPRHAARPDGGPGGRASAPPAVHAGADREAAPRGARERRPGRDGSRVRPAAGGSSPCSSRPSRAAGSTWVRPRPTDSALASLEGRVDGLGQALERQGRHLVAVVGLGALCLSLALGMLALLLAPAGALAGIEPGRRRSPGSRLGAACSHAVAVARG